MHREVKVRVDYRATSLRRLPTTSTWSAPWAVPLVLTLSLLVPLWVLMQPHGQPRGLALILQTLLTSYAGLRLGTLVVRQRLELLQGSFWLFVYSAMGVAGMAQLHLGNFPTPVSGGPAQIVLGVTLVALGCLLFDLGALFASAVRVPRPPPVRTVEPGATERRLLLLTPVALAATALLVVALGGLSTRFQSRQAVTEMLEETGRATAESQVGSALLTGFGSVPVLVLFLALTRHLVVHRTARQRLIVWAAWTALLCANVVVNNPISNPRYWALTVLVAMAFVIAGSRARWVGAMLVVGAFVAVVLFPYLDRFRYEEGAQRSIESDSILGTLTLKDFDQLPMVINAVTYTDLGEGYTDGRQLLGTLFFWVPRELWSGKASDTGVLLGEWVGTTNTNLSSPLWAEAWIDFGWVFFVPAFLALGFAARWWDERYRELVTDPRDSASPALLVVPIVAGYAFILLRGSLLQAMGRVAILVLVALAISVALGRDRTSPESADPPPQRGTLESGPGG